MADTIRIQMMDTFAVYIDEMKVEQMVEKSRKGVALMQLLILSRGESVPNSRLMAALWPEEKNSNPESALKTLVSRMRTLLNQIVPGMGKCIVADRSAYTWQCLPGMTVDLYQIEDIFARLESGKESDKSCRALCDRLMSLYTGDLLQSSDQNEWALSRATSLHNKYMSAVSGYLEMLKREEDYESIISVCRNALNVDNFDDHLHMELMSALIKTERNNEAMHQYKYVMHLYYHYLGIRPSDDMQEFYTQIVNCGKNLEFSLESIRNELWESNAQRGAFVCEYVVFKEIFNLQMRNLERLGSVMFLGVIMVGNINGKPLEAMKQDNIMQGLLDILRMNLRKGDTITQFSPTIVALLLPTVNYNTGHMVMERMKNIFYKKYPNSNVVFNYRIGPLSSEAKPPEIKPAEPKQPENGQPEAGPKA